MARIPRAIVVEDDARMRRIITKVLGSCGMQIRAASDGLEALEAFTQNPAETDLICADIKMPNMDGMEFARRLRQQGADVPIIFVSGTLQKSQDGYREKSHLYLMSKPFSPIKLAEVAKEMLAKPRPQPAPRPKPSPGPPPAAQAPAPAAPRPVSPPPPAPAPAAGGRGKVVASVAAVAVAALLGTGVWSYVRIMRERDAAVLAKEAEAEQRRIAEGKRREAEQQKKLAEDRQKEAEAARKAEAERRQLTEKKRQEAEAERKRSEAVSKFLADMLAKADPTDKGGRKAAVLQVVDSMSDEVARRFGEDAQTRQSLHATIGTVYLGLGQYEKAESHLSKAEALAKELFGEKHQDYATSLNGLAKCLNKQGKYAKAEPLWAKALPILAKSLGKSHKLTKSVERQLQDVREKLKGQGGKP